MTFTANQVAIIDDEYSKLTSKLHILVMSKINQLRSKHKKLMTDVDQEIFRGMILVILKDSRDNLKKQLSLGGKTCDYCNRDATYFCCNMSYCDVDFKVHAVRCMRLGVEV